MRALLALSLVLAVACKDRPLEPASAPPTEELGARGALRRLLDEAGDAATACERDEDCAVTCHVDGQCCDQLCQCTNVYARTFVDTLEAQRSRLCRGEPCPVASCMAPTEQVVARCDAGRCVAEVKPLGLAPPRRAPIDVPPTGGAPTEDPAPPVDP